MALRSVLFAFLCLAWTSPQEMLSHYVFNQFSEGSVRLLSGAVQSASLNYNALTAEMVFDNHGKYEAIANAKDVDTIVIQGRRFVPGMKGFYEVLLQGPISLYMEYNCTIKEPGANIGYGMSSTTSAASPLKSLIQSGGAYNLKLPEGYEVVLSQRFLLLRLGKFVPVNSARQLTGYFPEKKAAISEYVKSKQPDFSSKDDMIAMVRAISESQ
jgi:hypothetical protein